MHLDLERKENGAGGCEGETHANERTHRNHHTYNNNNSHNNNNNNNTTNDSNHSRGYREGESESHRSDRNDESDEDSNEPRTDRVSLLNNEQHPDLQGTIPTTRDMEMGDLDDRTRPNDTEKSTALIMLPKTQENKASKPMLDKVKNSVISPQEGKKFYQYLATLIAGLMAVQIGMMIAWTSPILPYLNKKESFLPNKLDDSEESWISSLLPVGAVIGAAPAGKIADRFGRKPAIIGTAMPFLISWLIIIFTEDLTGLYVARFIGGIGAGAACVIVPVYIGEAAESSIRGALGSFFPLLLSFGIEYTYIVGAYASYLAFNISCCLTLLPFFVSVYFLPESPMWLVHQNHMSEAIKSLEVLRGKRYEFKAEIIVLQAESERLENRRGGIRDLVGTKAGRKALGTCIGLMWFQQMSGIDAVLFYTVKIFEDADSTIESHVATIIFGIVEVIMAIVVATVIDRFGRKPLLVLSGTAMAICFGVLGYYFKIKADGSDVSSIGWLPLTCLTLFNIVFSMGYGSVPFAIISELFSPETKGVATSISIMVHWSLVFAVTKIFPTMLSSIGQAKTFWTFGSMTALSAIFGFLCVPETKGKTLQEIQEKLEFGKKRIRVPINDKELA